MIRQRIQSYAIPTYKICAEANFVLTKATCHFTGSLSKDQAGQTEEYNRYASTLTPGRWH